MIHLKTCLYLICHDDVAKVILFYQIKDKKSLKVKHESLKNVFRPSLYQFFFLHLHLDKQRQKMDRINSY
ncbi:unknown [Prevotella sp. CAG:732]|nr:unknown [Prevotella sp. CAG:732]